MWFNSSRFTDIYNFDMSAHFQHDVVGFEIQQWI